MSVVPYSIQCYRDSKWIEIETDKLLPGDIVSVGTCNILLLSNCPSMNLPVRVGEETTVPADILLVNGNCIVNEAMLSGESTPLLKESIQLLESTENLDTDGQHKNAVLFSGTKILQASESCMLMSFVLGLHLKILVAAENPFPITTPNQGCLGVVLRTGFGTAQGQLVRTMIFSTERISANNLESFLFLGFLLIFAIAASWYVWTKGQSSMMVVILLDLHYAGIERNLKKSKLLLDCILVITSVVPPELPMELSLAVNASLVALSKFGV